MNQTFKFSGLNERAQHLLKVLVERYISDGQPVGSRALSREAGLSLSPATIRNVMADLEELGLITAPHTSAGRMPTASGYRFFIDSLLTVKPLQQEVIRQFQLGLEPLDDAGEILQTASRLLSDMTHMAGLVTLPHRESVTFRMIEFLSLSDQRILVILVTNEQEVQNRIIHPSRSFSASELTSAANYLNAVYAGKDLVTIRESLMLELQQTREQMNDEAIKSAEIADLAFQGSGQRQKKDFVLTGEINLLDFDEWASMERLRNLFLAFRQKEDLVHLLDRCLESSGVKIFIGEESGYLALEQCSLVTSSYAIDDHNVGVLGVIGPTRMKYGRIIPLVDLTAKLLGAALNHKSLSPS
ncbi:MAG: heat-inducible transcription repressor HrcA [Candidatus Methylumidiphilus alinenensis]|uniref:Heat-inducible transcription repressor HrcA n=1 Tax=Candidatus Methylumidiphilus alinenensis TaxID=2202197 RepID=A0A2W4RBR6_9GAMM|nr:MAG: heat-inducible transcription repressor HrcA [Candidatus Methylumidiphilus alinenensis]